MWKWSVIWAKIKTKKNGKQFETKRSEAKTLGGKMRKGGETTEQENEMKTKAEFKRGR